PQPSQVVRDQILGLLYVVDQLLNGPIATGQLLQEAPPNVLGDQPQELYAIHHLSVSYQLSLMYRHGGKIKCPPSTSATWSTPSPFTGRISASRSIPTRLRPSPPSPVGTCACC